MAKSPAERFQELNIEINALRERDTARKDALSELKSELKDERDARHKVELELADLKRQFQDHLAQYQEWDKRRWTLILALLGSVLALASGLTIALVKK